MGKVKAQLLDEQEHDQFMRDQEPDFDDYALAMKAKDKDDQREWDKVNDEGKQCKNCEHCELTHDAYGTGDSPCMRECTADDPSECPGLMV
jgi:hypothetical protein